VRILNSVVVQIRDAYERCGRKPCLESGKIKSIAGKKERGKDRDLLDWTLPVGRGGWERDLEARNWRKKNPGFELCNRRRSGGHQGQGRNLEVTSCRNRLT
jgi:hypothetical protein